MGHETSRHALLCPVRRGFLLDASSKAHSSAELSAESALGETTIWPVDRARHAFRLLRQVPRPGVDISAVSSLCNGRPSGDPRMALRALCKSYASSCSCHLGVCCKHGWQLPLSTRSQLREDFCLETDLFARPGKADPAFHQWYSLDEEGLLTGSSGSPWDQEWGGMFALCAPRLSPGMGQVVLDNILTRAHQAIASPRPTRIVLVVEGSTMLGGAIPECTIMGDAKVVIVENAAAVHLSAKAGVPRILRALPARWGPEPAPPPRSSPLVPSWHPWAAPHMPEWLPDACWETQSAYRAFGEHDRYASSLGIPSRNFALVLACQAEGCDRPSGRSRSAADRAVAAAALPLLRGAQKAWLHSCECRRAWWQHMNDGIMDSEIEIRQLRLHQRGRTLAKRKYERQMASRASKRRRVAHLDAIALHEGTTRRELMASHPESRHSVPTALAALVPLPAAPRWSGTLRRNPPRTRISLCDDYVGEERARRWRTRRTLERERRTIARRFGR